MRIEPFALVTGRWVNKQRAKSELMGLINTSVAADSFTRFGSRPNTPGLRVVPLLESPSKLVTGILAHLSALQYDGLRQVFLDWRKARYSDDFFLQTLLPQLEDRSCLPEEQIAANVALKLVSHHTEKLLLARLKADPLDSTDLVSRYGGESIVPALQSRFHDGTFHEKIGVLFVLRDIGKSSPAAEMALLKLQSTIDPWVLDGIKNPQKPEFPPMIRAIGDFGSAKIAEDVFPKLLDIFEEGDWEVKFQVVHTLARMQEKRSVFGLRNRIRPIQAEIDDILEAKFLLANPFDEDMHDAVFESGELGSDAQIPRLAELFRRVFNSRRPMETKREMLPMIRLSLEKLAMRGFAGSVRKTQDQLDHLLITKIRAMIRAKKTIEQANPMIQLAGDVGGSFYSNWLGFQSINTRAWPKKGDPEVVKALFATYLQLEGTLIVPDAEGIYSDDDFPEDDE